MILATLCTNVVTYFQITLINRWFLDAWPMVEMTLVQFVIILVWIWGSRYIYSRIYRARNLLVIYGDRDPGDLIHKMNLRKDKYHISGKIHVDAGEKEIFKMMKEYDGVIIWDLPSTVRNRYLKHCFAHSIRCYLSPKISDVILMGSERIHLFDTPLLVAKNMGLSLDQRVCKRLLDIVVSGIGIVVASPIMLIAAICVKFYDGGPVFYFQERLTLSGKPFKICKFRSMCVDSEKNGARLASKHDSRITPVGKILRNLHLDELPQLFNVFRGDMSLVGPRPERQTLVHEYCREIPVPASVSPVSVRTGHLAFKYIKKLRLWRLRSTFLPVPVAALMQDVLHFYPHTCSELADFKWLSAFCKPFLQIEYRTSVIQFYTRRNNQHQW